MMEKVRYEMRFTAAPSTRAIDILDKQTARVWPVHNLFSGLKWTHVFTSRLVKKLTN